MSTTNTAIGWMSDQLRLHTELQTEECLSFATYICSMSTQSDMDEFLSSLMQEVPPARRAKIIKECIKRRGLLSTTTPPPAPQSKQQPAGIWASNTLTKSNKTKKKGQIISSNVAPRRDIAITTSSKNNTTDNTFNPTNSSTTKTTTAPPNPFLVGGPPAKFVCNCLKCGLIIWYNEPNEKKCNSHKSQYCHDLFVDAISPETGIIDPDYALTKKARKKNRKQREERERRELENPTTANATNTNAKPITTTNPNDDDSGEDEVQLNEPIATSASLTAARERVARLVQYDKERSARSQVYDDQADYFADSSSTWLSPEEKQQAADKDKEIRRLKAKRGRTTFVVDFAGRRIMDTEGDIGMGVETSDTLGAESMILVHEDRRTTTNGKNGLNGNGGDGETKMEGGSGQATSMPTSKLYGRAANVYTDVLSRLAARAKMMEKKSLI